MTERSLRCVLNPKVEVPCEKCSCDWQNNNGLYFLGDKRRQLYVEALKERGLDVDDKTIEAHLNVLDANIRLYSKKNIQLEYVETHQFEQLERSRFLRFTSELPKGKILIIGSFCDDYSDTDREIVYLDIPTAHNVHGKAVRADGILLPFADGYFAGVYVSQVLHHIYDPVLLINEALRVLIASGLFQSHGDPNRKLAPNRKPGLFHFLYRVIYWSLRLIFDRYLLHAYPPRENFARKYDTQDSALAEYHDFGVYVERGFDSNYLMDKLSKRYREVVMSFSWDYPTRLPFLHSLLIKAFKLFKFGPSAYMENISIKIKK